MHRILIPTHEFPPFSGGIGRLIRGLAAGAAALDYDVHVLAPDFGEDTLEFDRGQPFGVTRFVGGQFSGPRDLLPFTVRCRREITRLRPSIIHAVDPAGHLSLQALSKLGFIKHYFFTVTGSELLVYRSRTPQRVWMRGAFSRVRGVCAISSATREDLVENFDVSRSKVFVSNPGIDPLWSELKVSDREDVRRRWGIDSDAFLLVTVARRVAEKGHFEVLEGLASLPPELRERVVYCVAGSGPDAYRGHLETVASRSSLRVLMPGFISDVDTAALYDSSDAFIMLSRQTPTRVEGFGLVYIEAGARGLPSIARGVGGVADAVRDGQTGILLSPDAQARDVADAVTRLFRDRGLRSRLGSRAKAFAGEFTWQRHARETYERFAEAL